MDSEPCYLSGQGACARNWTCACKPGILGPPVSPLPRLLLATVESLGCGPPVSWRFSQDLRTMNLELTWTLINGRSFNSLAAFPPELMTEQIVRTARSNRSSRKHHE